MTHDEILRRYRSENKDEGTEFAFHNGRKFGVVGMLTLSALFSIYNLYTQNIIANYSIMAIFFGYLAGESLGAFYVRRKNRDILSAIIAFSICLIFTLLFFKR